MHGSRFKQTKEEANPDSAIVLDFTLTPYAPELAGASSEDPLLNGRDLLVLLLGTDQQVLRRIYNLHLAGFVSNAFNESLADLWAVAWANRALAEKGLSQCLQEATLCPAAAQEAIAHQFEPPLAEALTRRLPDHEALR